MANSTCHPPSFLGYKLGDHMRRFEAFARTQKIDRGGVQAALRQIDFTGLGAKYAFDPAGKLLDPQTYVFEYDKNRQPQLMP